MAGKFSILFISFFLVSAFALPPPVREDGSLVDIIKRIVALVEKILDKLIVDVNKAIDDVSGGYSDFHTKVVAVTKEFLLNIVRRFKTPFDTIAERSSDAGKKLAKCAEENDESYVNLVVDFFDKFSSCAGDEFITLIKALKPLVADLTGVQEDAKQIANQINACADDDIGCAVQVGLDLLQVVAEIPDAIKNDITPILDNGKAYVEKIKECFKSNSDSFYTDAGAALEKTATCAAA